MKRWLLVVVAACSSKKHPPPPAPVVKDPAIAKPTMKPSQKIDLPDAGVADLQVVPIAGATNGRFDVRWRSMTVGTIGIVCRIEVYNLVTFTALSGAGNGGTIDESAEYKPDPFVLTPHTCEIRFFDGPRITARACYQDGALTAAACPTGAFPPPKLPDGMAIDIQGASVHLVNDTLDVKALVTLDKPLPDDASVSLRCDGVDSDPQSHEVLTRPLLAAGETRFASARFHAKQPLAADPKQCELRVLSKGKTLGVACIAGGETDAGPCSR